MFVSTIIELIAQGKEDDLKDLASAKESGHSRILRELRADPQDNTIVRGYRVISEIPRPDLPNPIFDIQNFSRARPDILFKHTKYCRSVGKIGFWEVKNGIFIRSIAGRRGTEDYAEAFMAYKNMTEAEVWRELPDKVRSSYLGEKSYTLDDVGEYLSQTDGGKEITAKLILRGPRSSVTGSEIASVLDDTADFERFLITKINSLVKAIEWFE